ncbi:MAG: AAA family ATPase [Bacteroidales bacterium]
MKKVELKNLKLHNFKCYEDFELDFSSITNIQGGNEEGKSTIFEAYLWVFSGKNSKGEVSNVQRRDINGNIILNQITMGEVVIAVDGENITFARELHQKINNESIVGNKSIYSINGLPKEKTEYLKKLNEICEVGLWLMLSDLNSFFRLKTDDRRKIIISLAKEVSDIEIAKNFPKVLEALEKGQTVDDLKKITQAGKKKCKESLELIPARLDQLQKSKVKDIDYASIREEIKKKENEISSIDERLKAILEKDNSKIVDKIRARANQASNELYYIEGEIRDNAEKEKRIKVESMERLKGEIKLLEIDIISLEREIENNNYKIDNCTDQQKKLLEQYNYENKRVFDGSNICSECGQFYPISKKEKALEIFNIAKSDRLSAVKKLAEEQKNEKNNLIAQNNKANELINAKNLFIKEKHSDIEKIAKEIGNLPTIEALKLQSEEYTTKESALKQLKEELKSVSDISPIDTTEFELKKSALHNEIKELSEKLGLERVNKNIDKLKTELKEESKILNNELSDLESVEYQILQFNKQKIDVIESKINRYFEVVSWKMYEANLTNDNEKPICEAYVNGVPYGETNDAMTMIIGIDVINGLSKANNISVPLFIDRYESLEALPNIDTQTITLEVVKGSKLTVNYKK